MPMKKSQRSLRAWTKQKWRTKSGKPSTQGPKATGERYLPSAAINALSAKEYAAGLFSMIDIIQNYKRLQRMKAASMRFIWIIWGCLLAGLVI